MTSRIKCEICKKHDRKVTMYGIGMCNACLRPFVVGTKVGKITAYAELMNEREYYDNTNNKV